MAILQGFLIGLATVVFIGPVFFLLIQSTLHNGKKAGFAVAFGIFFSDILVALLCYLGFSTFFQEPKNQQIIKFTGAAIIISVGLIYLLKKGATLKKNTQIDTKQRSFLFLKGFSINFFNPFVFVVWIAFFKHATNTFSLVINQQLFIAAVLFGILTIDLLKVIAAQNIQKKITPKRLQFLYKTIGIILIAFALKMLFW